MISDARRILTQNILPHAPGITITGMCHPGVFWLYMFTFGSSFGNSPGMVSHGGNVYALNLWVFVPFAALVYGGWLWWHCVNYARKRPHFYTEKFIDAKIWGSVVITFFGAFHLLMWIGGMEGNIFGFLLALPMLVISVISLLMYARCASRVKLGEFDRTEPAEGAA